MIHVDPNHTESNQPIPEDSTNILSINDSADICLIKNILSSPVHLVNTTYLVPDPQIFTYGIASDPQSPSYDSSSESVTPKGNTTPRNNPHNPVPKVPAEPDLYPSLSDYSLSDSADSSDKDYYKQRRCAENNNNKCWSKTCFDEPIKKCANLTSGLFTDVQKSKVRKFKLDEDTIQHRVYLLSFIDYI